MQRQSKGFTLIELTAIIVVLSIVSIAVIPKLTSNAVFELQATRDNIVAGLFFAQQAAIARDSPRTNLNIRFIANANSIDIQQDDGGSVISLGAGIYPLSLPSGMSLTTATVNYDKLGRTSATTLTLTDDSGSDVDITIEASGYAY